MVDRIKVAIIEDDVNYLDAITTILEEEKEIIIHGTYENGLDFMNSLNSPFLPDVCLIDVMLPDTSGLKCAKKVKEINNDIKIIIMTAYENMQSFVEANKINADYIEKGKLSEMLINKIILSKKKTVPERVLLLKDNSKINDYFEYNEFITKLQNSKNNYKNLSEMQTKVLKMKVDGKKTKDIALSFNISTNTVNSHLERASKKLELPDPIKIILKN